MKRIFFIVGLLLITIFSLVQANQSPIVRAKLGKDFAAPGEAISLQITVLVPTWLPSAPEFPEFDRPNLIVRLPPNSSWPISEKVNGETWNGIAREYQLYPMIAKPFKIPAKRITVTYADPGTREPIVVKLSTQEIEFEGRIPEGAKGLEPFIAAQKLTLEQVVEGDPLALTPGDALKRTVTARLTGAAAIFLPSLIPPLSNESISSYPNEPIVDESIDDGVVIGERIEKVTYVATSGSSLKLKPIKLRWWNINTNTIETAILDGVKIKVSGSLVKTVQSMSRQHLVLWGLALALLFSFLFIVVTRYQAYFCSFWKRQRALYLDSEIHAYRHAKRQLRKHNFDGALRAILDWQTKLDLETLETPALSDAMYKLGKEFYGQNQQKPSNNLWSTTERILRSERKKILKRINLHRDNFDLPPINPQ